MAEKYNIDQIREEEFYIRNEKVAKTANNTDTRYVGFHAGNIYTPRDKAIIGQNNMMIAMLCELNNEIELLNKNVLIIHHQIEKLKTPVENNQLESAMKDIEKTLEKISLGQGIVPPPRKLSPFYVTKDFMKEKPSSRDKGKEPIDLTREKDTDLILEGINIIKLIREGKTVEEAMKVYKEALETKKSG